MKWVTRERPKIDRLACPWLIKNFVDPDAEFYFVPEDMVLKQSQILKAIPFDIPEVEYSHYKDEVTFDYIIRKHQLKDPALRKMAKIVRGADTDRHDIAPEAAGLWAISVGLSKNIQNDFQLLEIGFVLYDALYTWAKEKKRVKHIEGSVFENQLQSIYQKFLMDKKNNAPKWVSELKELIQDQIDAQYVAGLGEISQDLNLHPAYLSREFPKYFENHNFAEYMRLQRINKSVELIRSSSYTLTEIAYIAGFSDQSHFSRIFKKQIGMTPTAFKQSLNKKTSPKSKKNTKD